MEALIDILIEYPWFTNLVILMGTARLVCKPLFTIIDAIVQATPTKQDDKLWAGVRSSKGMKAALWFIDYIASVKLPEKKPQK